MDMNIWEILGMEETRDIKSIKEAYMEKLEMYHPEEDQEGFQKLREAYEKAIGVANDTSREGSLGRNTEKATPTEIWMQKVEEIYEHFKDRIDEKKWKVLLEDEVCFGIDSRKEIEEHLLIFLMEHYNLPRNIWRVLDEKFNWMENQEELIKRFSEDFIKFLVNHILYDTKLNYEFFCIGEEDKSGVKVDKEYDRGIDLFYKANTLLNEGKINEGAKLVEQLEKLSIDHLDFKVLSLCYKEKQGKLDEAIKYGEELIKVYPDHTELCYILARIYIRQGNRERGKSLYEYILLKKPDHLEAQIGIAREYIEEERLSEAECWYKKAIRNNPYNLYVNQKYEEASQLFIKHYKKRVNKNNRDEKSKLKLAYFYYENDKMSLSKHLLQEVNVTTENRGYYYELMGKICAKERQYEKALTYFTSKVVIGESYNRRPEVYEQIGLQLQHLKRYEDALDYYDKALKEISDEIGKVTIFNKKGYVLNKLHKYEEAIIACNEALKIKSDIAPLYVNRAEAFYHKEAYKEALNDCNRSRDIYPYYLPCYLLQVKIYYKLGQLEKVVELGDEVELLGTQQPEIMYYKAQALEGTGRLTEAKALYLKLLGHTDKEAEIYSELAYVYIVEEEYEEALRCINESIKRDEKVDSYYIRAMIYRSIDKYIKAIKDYDKIIEIEAKPAAAYNNKALIYEEIGKIDEAVSCYKKALELEPRHPTANNNLGELYDRHGKHGEAIKYYSRQLLIEESENCYINRAWCHIALGQLEEARMDFSKALVFNPKNPYIYNGQGITYVKENKFKESIFYFETAIKKESSCLLPYINIGGSYMKIGRYEEAIAYYTKGIEENAEKEKLYIGRANAYYKLKKYEEVIADLNTVLDINDQNIEGYSGLGRVYEVMGKHEKAIEYFKEGIKIIPQNTKLHRELAYLLIEVLKDYNGALVFYNEVLDVQKDTAECYQYRALVYKCEGKSIRAKFDYKKAIHYYLEQQEEWGEDLDRNYEIANCYFMLNKLDEAATYYRSTIDLLAKHKDEDKKIYIDSLTRLGQIYEAQGKSTEATWYHNQIKE